MYLALFSVVPEVYGIIMSLRSAYLSNLSMSSFAGFMNYLLVLQNPAFWQSVQFSLGFAVVSTLLELLLGFLLAVYFNRSFPGKGVIISLLILPIMIAPALMGIMYELILNGFVGPVSQYLKVVGVNIPALMGGQGIYIVVLVIDVLEWSPFLFVLIYTALTSIPQEVGEAAAMDGTSRWRYLSSIALPLLRPVLVVAFFLQFMAEFRRFSMFYVFTGGGPGTLTTTASIFIYKTAFQLGNIGQANAASEILVLLLMLPLIFAIRFMVRESNTFA